MLEALRLGLQGFLESMGFGVITGGQIIMLLVSFVLLYLAIVKGFEPLLLLPIAFGMLLANLPLAGLMAEPTGTYGEPDFQAGGLLYYLYQGVKLGIYPPLIFMGVGAMTDFGPLIANPRSILLGAAAQFGIFAVFIGAILLGFTGAEASSIGIIGGADGPTAIYLTSKLAPHLLGPIAIAAYSYMALVPIIQPPIMRALTTKEERMTVMDQLRPVSKRKDHLSYNDYCSGILDSSRCSSVGRDVNAGEPLNRIRGHREIIKDSTKRTHEHRYHILRSHCRGDSQCRNLPKTPNPNDHWSRLGSLCLWYSGGRGVR